MPTAASDAAAGVTHASIHRGACRIVGSRRFPSRAAAACAPALARGRIGPALGDRAKEARLVRRVRTAGAISSETAEATTTTREPDASTTLEEEDERFNFQRQWYPIAVIDGIAAKSRKREPIAVHLLGKRLVIWRQHDADDDADFSVAADLCPHRLAPLSEGRVEDGGELMCSYHGWRFAETTGACTAIPQAPDETKDRMQRAPQSCINVLPSMSKHGLLWVWPDGSEEGRALADATPALTLDPLETDPDTRVELRGWYQRDVPYDWDTLVENIVDPSHVPFAHHGVQGNRYAGNGTGNSTGLRLDHLTTEGCKVRLHPRNVNADPKEVERLSQSFIEFRAPFYVRYSFGSPPRNPLSAGKGKGKEKGKGSKGEERESGPLVKSRLGGDGASGSAGGNVGGERGEAAPPKPRTATLMVLCIPTRPGHARVLFKFAVLNAQSIPMLARLMIRHKPVWMDHMTRNKVFDTDGYLLYLQERELQAGTKQEWRKTYHMPTSADVLVTAFRSWVDRFTEGGPYGDALAAKGREAGAALSGAGGARMAAEGRDPFASPTPEAHLSKRDVMDRWDQHTKHCTACLGAFKMAMRMQWASVVVTIAGACFRSLPVALLGLAAWLGLEKFKQLFVYVDHVHAHAD